jgi:hypothetical protein
LKKNGGTENRDMVICNKCMWAISLLKGSHGFNRCPFCNGMNLEIIPVEDYENYKMMISPERGLGIEFSGKP